MGNYNKIDLKAGKSAAGTLSMNAKGDTNTRLFAGAVSVSDATDSTGAAAAIANDNDTVETRVGKSSGITAEGNISVKSSGEGSIEVYNTAASVGVGFGGETSTAIGGSVNTIVSNHKAVSTIDESAALTSTTGGIAVCCVIRGNTLRRRISRDGICSVYRNGSMINKG